LSPVVQPSAPPAYAGPAAVGFGPPPSMSPQSPPRPVPTPRVPTLPDAARTAAPGRRTRRVALAVTSVVAVGALAVTATTLWPWDGDGGNQATGKGKGKGQGTGTPTGSPTPVQGGGDQRKVPYAPSGYRLRFANKPFTFAPPAQDGQANHLDLDIPQSTYMERDALPGPAELVYNSDGWLGSLLVVVGERKTVCTEQQQTAVLSHPLPAAELRLGRQVKVGTILCAITSNDNVAEAEITEIVPGDGPDGLPTYKGYVTVWQRPDVNQPG
ncbi:hypothetical protein N4P33_34995, partial [Streptomyces sp. 15-116A]|nr:hypothetical protein [Streptomyces sp. 15-116A]